MGTASGNGLESLLVRRRGKAQRMTLIFAAVCWALWRAWVVFLLGFYFYFFWKRGEGQGDFIGEGAGFLFGGWGRDGAGGGEKGAG